MHELRGAPEPGLEELIEQLAPCDLVLVEGFKREAMPKLEVHRHSVEQAEFLYPHDPYIVAIASDDPVESRLPTFELDDVEPIAGFVVEHAQRIAAPRPRLVAGLR